LEEISFLPDHKGRTVAIYTDSQVTLDSLRNNSIQTPIIADIRKCYNNYLRKTGRFTSAG
jgi:hypothetical protein